METAKLRQASATTDEILRATIELIGEHDISGLTLDMVADRTGVSKATIYRRWRSRANLIYDALRLVTKSPETVPDTGSLRGDLSELIGGMVQFIERPGIGRVFSSFLNAAVRDEKFAALRQAVRADAFSAYEVVFGRAVERGELASDTDFGFITDLLVSHFLLASISDPGKSRRPQIERMIDLVVDSFGSSGKPAPRITAGRQFRASVVRKQSKGTSTRNRPARRQ